MIDRIPSVEDEAWAQDIVDTVRDPLLILDSGLLVRSANRAFYQTFRVSPLETEGRRVDELGYPLAQITSKAACRGAPDGRSTSERRRLGDRRCSPSKQR